MSSNAAKPTLAETIKAARATIREQVLSLVESDRWRKQLDALAVHSSVSAGRLSFGNILLLAAQAGGYRRCPACNRWGLGRRDLLCPDCGTPDEEAPVDANMVATFKRWGDLKRQVRKGSKGMMILRPIILKRKGKESAAGEAGSDSDDGGMLLFRAMYVFSIDQTDGEALPPIELPRLEDTSVDYSALFHMLRDWAISSGTAKTVELLPPDPRQPEGYWRASESKIVVRGEASNPQTLSVLAHEIAHAVAGHAGYGTADNVPEKTRADREVVAESVAYTVCRALGLDTSRCAFDYIAGWATEKARYEKLAKADQEAAATELRKVIEETGNRVTKISHTILSALFPQSSESATESEE